MLVQFAMVVFGLFGIAALTIDLGLVRVTQATMQAAADTGALEGMRFRNHSSDGFESDCTRRAAARALMARAFADSAQAQLGAGPSFAVVNGQGAADVFGQIVIDDTQRTFKPDLQLNQATNAGHGDMVSGMFTYQPTPPPNEADDYARTDFIRRAPPQPGASGLAACPDDPPDPWTAPPSESGPIDDDAFLVRLRRTTNASGLDDEAGVSSGGATIPLLFGRGGTITAPDTGFSVRRDGLTVRATAIAGARPALTTGLPVDSMSMPGATPFVLTRAYFEALSDPEQMPVSPDGTIGPPAAPVGAFLSSPLTAVGQPETAPTPTTCSTALSEIRGFVPLVAPIGTTATSRVIGFGRVELRWNCDSPATVELSRLSQRVARANASAHLPGGLPTDVTPDDAVLVMEANRAFTSAGFGLLAPALVR